MAYLRPPKGAIIVCAVAFVLKIISCTEVVAFFFTHRNDGDLGHGKTCFSKRSMKSRIKIW